MTERKVRIKNVIHLYKTKAPFVESGVSVQGALEYDEERDKVKCHECGEWFDSLPPHVRIQHGLKTRDYKIKHGLKMGSSIENERVRQSRVLKGVKIAVQSPERLAELRLLINRECINERNKLISRPRMELRNENGSCHAQILDRLRKAAESFGGCPSILQLRSIGMFPGDICRKFNVKSMSGVFSLVGMESKRRKKFGIRANTYTDAECIEMLRDFYVSEGRVPSVSDCRRGLLPDQTVFTRIFGGWVSALRHAGLEQAWRTSRRTGLQNNKCFLCERDFVAGPGSKACPACRKTDAYADWYTNNRRKICRDNGKLGGRPRLCGDCGSCANCARRAKKAGNTHQPNLEKA